MREARHRPIILQYYHLKLRPPHLRTLGRATDSTNKKQANGVKQILISQRVLDSGKCDLFALSNGCVDKGPHISLYPSPPSRYQEGSVLMGGSIKKIL